ncbi:MAG: SDR family NAD(P)-dependent oxidoreductase [Chloroflexi bacterium]|nr:SDR family NAD(P)-dependent oxidoreductase [Chloroflexota bacterium]
MILVTGGSGFVGRALVRRLLAEGYPVRVLARHSERARPLIEEGAEFVAGDVTRPQTLRGATQSAEAVIHLVAIIRERGDQTLDGVIHQGTRNILAEARSAGVRRFIFQSALGTIPEPRYPYIWAKWQAEQAVQQSGLDWTILRPSIIFGEGDEFLRKLAFLVRNVVQASFLPLEAKPSPWQTLTSWGRWVPILPIAGRGQIKFQPIWVEDVARCHLHCLRNPQTEGRIIPIGGPDQLGYEEMIDLLIRAYGLRRLKVHVPLAAMKPLVGVLEMIVPHFPVTRQQLDLMAIDNTTDLDAVSKVFGFTPASLGEKLDYLVV